MNIVVLVWNTHTDEVLFKPSRIRVPEAAILRVPGVLQYTPGGSVFPDISGVVKEVVQIFFEAALEAIILSPTHCLVSAVPICAVPPPR